MEIELNVPTLWNNAQVSRWAAAGNGTCAVRSTYGCLQTQLGGHGRAPGDVPYVDPEQLVEHVAHVRNTGIEFLYLLNGLCRHLDLDDAPTRAAFLDQLGWILDRVAPDCLVISDRRVARLVRSVWAAHEIRIRVSTIAGVRKEADLLPWIELGIDGVVLHHDCGRDFDAIVALGRFVAQKAPHVGIELLLNEGCIRGCFARQAHYARLAATTIEYTEGFQQTCNVPRFEDPARLLAAAWIRPEDLAVYRSLGVRRFKIAGREMSEPWLDRCVRAYILECHEGNLLELFTMTPPGLGVGAADIIHLENASLRGFLEDIVRVQHDQESVCRRWASQLWQEGLFRIRDPEGQYTLTQDGPRCTRPGKFLRMLIDQFGVRDEVLHKIDLPFSAPSVRRESR